MNEVKIHSFLLPYFGKIPGWSENRVSIQKLKKKKRKIISEIFHQKKRRKIRLVKIELFNDHKYSHLKSQTLWFSLQIRHQFPSNQRLWNEIRVWYRQFFNESTMFRFGRSKRSHR